MFKKLLFTCTLITIMTCSVATYASDVIRYNGSVLILRRIMYKAALEFKNQESIEMDLKGKDTISGINKLLNGEADIAGGGRALKQEELEKGLVQRKLFLDARVFIVNRRIQVDTLSTDQIADILLGKITNWNQVGDPQQSDLHVVSPHLDSAHYKNQKKLIGFKELPEKSFICPSVPEVFDKVHKSLHNTIGFTSSAFVKTNTDVKIVTISKDGQPVPINQQNMESGAYPYIQSMYFYTMGEPEGNLKKFLDFMETQQAQEIITNAGFFLTK